MATADHLTRLASSLTPTNSLSSSLHTHSCVRLLSVFSSVTDAAEDRSRKVDDDTVILSNVQSGTSAVYQCNASNEFGYLLANAFVNVLGESGWKLSVLTEL